MRLGLFQNYSGPQFSIDIEAVIEAENLGFDSVWTSEAYGSDAVTPAAWILAKTAKIKVYLTIRRKKLNYFHIRICLNTKNQNTEKKNVSLK